MGTSRRVFGLLAVTSLVAACVDLGGLTDGGDETCAPGEVLRDGRCVPAGSSSGGTAARRARRASRIATATASARHRARQRRARRTRRATTRAARRSARA